MEESRPERPPGQAPDAAPESRWRASHTRLRAAVLGRDEDGEPRRPTLPRVLGLIVLAGAILGVPALFTDNAVGPLLLLLALGLALAADRFGTHRVLDALLGPEPSTTHDPPLGVHTLPRLIGPGSVPLALVLLAIQLALWSNFRPLADFAPFGLTELHAGSARVASGVAMLVAAACLVCAAYRPLPSWAGYVVAFWVWAQTSLPVGAGEPWPWSVPFLLGYLVVQYAVARRTRLWVAPLTWVAAFVVTIEAGQAMDARPLQPNLTLMALLSAGALALGLVPRVVVAVRARIREPEPDTRPWQQAVTDLLFGPDSSGRQRRLLHPWTLVRAAGPGSIPLALALWAIEAQLLRTDYRSLQGYDTSTITMVAIVGAVCVVLAAYRPLLAWALSLLSFWVTAVSVVPLDPPKPWPWLVPMLIGHLVIVYAVAQRSRPWVSALALSGTTALSLVAPEMMGHAEEFDTSANVMLIILLSAVSALIGFTVRLRQRSQAKLVQEEQVSAEERARRQMLEDRTRIARELHDVVAHHMSVIAVQSSTAAYRIDGLPDAAKEEFESIGDAARESLTEMRRLLGVLRADGSDAERAPQPTLDGLEHVAEATRRAGTPVVLSRDGLPDRIPAGVDLTAYRIVQEGLSNVVRHAPGAHATVRLRGDSEELTVRIRNGPPPSPRPGSRAMEAGGHGLIGMRERVGALGGRLEVGPTDDGGFLVEATLPWTVPVGGDLDRTAG